MNIKKINLNHSFIFFLFCNIFSLILFKFSNFILSPLFCLFLILIIGVSHGSLDHVKGGKLLKIFKIENIYHTKKFEISKKYQFLDEIFLRVLEKHPKRMSEIFFKMFQSSPKTIIKFLSNKSNFLEDLTIILKMPKWIFIKALFY